MKKISNLIINIFNIVIEIIYPNFCIGCRKKGEIICNDCKKIIKITEKETSDNIYAIFDYHDEIIRKSIWELKYHKKKIIGIKLGELIYEEFLEEIEGLKKYTYGQKILVIPVPISKNRNKNRGYNQTEIIAKNFCNMNKDIFEYKNNIVYKTKETTPQAKITNRNKRLKNMKGVFNIKNKEIIKNRTFIIMDDVTTTGATISEIIKIIKKEKPKKVIGLAVAH